MSTFFKNGKLFATVEGGKVLNLNKEVIGFVDEEGYVHIEGKRVSKIRDYRINGERNLQPVLKPMPSSKKHSSNGKERSVLSAQNLKLGSAKKNRLKTWIVISSTILLFFAVGFLIVFINNKVKKAAAENAVKEALAEKDIAEKALKEAIEKYIVAKNEAAKHETEVELAEKEMNSKKHDEEEAIERHRVAEVTTSMYEAEKEKAEKEMATKKQATEEAVAKKKAEEKEDEKHALAVKMAEKEVAEKGSALQASISLYNNNRTNRFLVAKMASNVNLAEEALQEAKEKYYAAKEAASKGRGAIGFPFGAVGVENTAFDTQMAAQRLAAAKETVERHYAQIESAKEDVALKRLSAENATKKYIVAKNEAAKHETKVELAEKEVDLKKGAEIKAIEKYMVAKSEAAKYEATKYGIKEIADPVEMAAEEVAEKDADLEALMLEYKILEYDPKRPDAGKIIAKKIVLAQAAVKKARLKYYDTYNAKGANLARDLEMQKGQLQDAEAEER